MFDKMLVTSAVKQAIRDVEHGHPYDNPFKPGSTMFEAYKGVYDRLVPKQTTFIKAK